MALKHFPTQTIADPGPSLLDQAKNIAGQVHLPQMPEVHLPKIPQIGSVDRSQGQFR